MGSRISAAAVSRKQIAGEQLLVLLTSAFPVEQLDLFFLLKSHKILDCHV